MSPFIIKKNKKHLSKLSFSAPSARNKTKRDKHLSMLASLIASTIY
jgi:hypothetical protein